jgi:hypothetical protein
MTMLVSRTARIASADLQCCRDLVGDREAGGESGRFDAEEVEQTRDAVLRWSI